MIFYNTTFLENSTSGSKAKATSGLGLQNIHVRYPTMIHIA